MRVVTVSASYGAGGSIIAPLVAEKLGVDFLDRGLTAGDEAAVSMSTEGGSTEAGSRGKGSRREMAGPEEDVTQSWWERILEAFASVPDEYGAHLNVPIGGSGGALRMQAEKKLLDWVAERDGGVVLGYAGAIVLQDAFRVRLDGPEARRVEAAMRIEGVDRRTATERMVHSNRLRCEYWRRLYQRDIRDPAAYQLMIDSTLFEPEEVADMIVSAALRASRGHD